MNGGDATAAAAAGGVLIVFLLIGVAFYCYFAICLQTMARKTGTPDGWLAWIPIVNLYLMCKIGGKPGWWLILFFLPFINIVVTILVWIGMAEARGKPGWLGVLIIVPFVDLIIPGYLAFSD